ncbi:MAG: TRAM domain-containing protein [Candidatus Anstonellaceae archaeon]
MGFGGRGNYGDMPKPVKVGDELDVTIEAVAAKGDGIAKKDGFVIFVPGTAQGEACKIRITAVKASCAVAEKV